VAGAAGGTGAGRRGGGFGDGPYGGGAPTLVIEAFNVPSFTVPITFNREPS